MRPFHPVVIVILLAWLLASCGTFVVHERLDRMPHRVALLSVPRPGHYVVEQVSPNVLARASVNFKQADALFANEGFDVSASLERTVISDFARRGIEVVLIPVRREDPQKFFEDFDRLDLKDVDVVLDLVPTAVGYHFGPYGERSLAHPRPMLGIRVQAVSAHTRKLVYRDNFGYGYHVSPTQDDYKYVFDDNGALESNPRLAVAGLEHAARTVVDYLVRDLARYSDAPNGRN